MPTPDHATQCCPKRSPERGFTLVEVIVVLLIIGIIGAIAIPSISGTQEQLTTREGLATARSLQRAVDEFRLDHDGRVPSAAAADWHPRSGPQTPEARPPEIRNYMSGSGLEYVTEGRVVLCHGTGVLASGAVHGAPASAASCGGSIGQRGQVVLNRVGGNGAWGYWIDVFSGSPTNGAWTAANHYCTLVGGDLGAYRGQVSSTC